MDKAGWGLGLAALIFILDQLSKWVVLNWVMVSHQVVPSHVIPVTSFFNIIITWNRGISFGLLSSNNPYTISILCGIALVCALVLSLWIWQAETRAAAVAFGLVLGGALGNLTDRICYGAVADFLDFHAYGYHWYTFNIADCAIVIGVGLIILQYCKEMQALKKPL